jgi:UDP-GlcNAc:undecaprenyl-phosphate GlcNAc-1-phosphate transferase
MILPLIILGAFAGTVLCVPLVSRGARALGLYAFPSYDRWHRQAVPKVGGVAMIVPLLVVIGLTGFDPALRPLTVAVALMFLLGLVDDLRHIGPRTKLVGQMLVAATFLMLSPPIRIFGHPIADMVVAFGWIVLITNAMNLLDNIDGLAAGVSGIAGTSFLLVLYLGSGGASGPIALAVAAFVGVAAGFLVYNFHPASIFMGDGGSHLLGSFLACATLVATSGRGAELATVAAIPVVLLLIPIFDTAFVAVSRGLAGRSAFLGGRDHTSHRLVALGIGERAAVLMLYGLTCAGGAVALGLLALPPGFAWGLVAIYVAALGVIGVYLGHIEVAKNPVAAPPLPSELASRHRVYEVALDALLLGAAYYFAFAVRFREPLFHEFLPAFSRSLPLVVGLQLLALWISGKYRQVWASVGPTEILTLVRGVALGVGASVIALLYISRFIGYSRWVFVLDAVLAPVLLIGARVVLNGIDQYVRVRRTKGALALIYGAGRGGALAARELLQNHAVGLTPLGFLDDDPHKRRQAIDGLAVLGSLGDLERLLDEHPHRIAAVVVAITDLPAGKFDHVCSACARRGVTVRRVRFALEEVRQRTGPGQRVIGFPRSTP